MRVGCMQLLEQVESYLARTEMPPSTFGRMAVGDPRFVRDLRLGRRPRRETRARVYTYISSAGSVAQHPVVRLGKTFKIEGQHR